MKGVILWIFKSRIVLRLKINYTRYMPNQKLFLEKISKFGKRSSEVMNDVGLW